MPARKAKEPAPRNRPQGTGPKEPAMDDVTVADAEAHLSEPLQRVEAGETIRISRSGKTIAQLVPARTIDIAAIETVTDRMPRTDGDTVTKMRNEDRY
jgi:prevent-host-death family protein